MDLALFDFDGTITWQDSFVHFVLFATGKRRSLAGFLRHLTLISGFKLGIYPSSKVKERFFRYFFKGVTSERLDELCERFCAEVIPCLVKNDALERINWHIRRGDRVVVVSGSFEVCLRPWCRAMSLDLIGTRVEIKDGVVTGSFESPNCIGSEKIRRIAELFDKRNYGRVYGYGNSRGDLEMLKWSDEAFFKPFF